MSCIFRLAAATVALLVFLVAPQTSSAQSSLLDDLRLELDPEATMPVILETEGRFTVTNKSLYGGAQDPYVADSIGGDVFSTPKIQFGKIERVCKILGGCFEIDVPNSEPGVDIDVVSYFGAEFAVQLSGRAELFYEARVTGGAFDADLPVEVKIRLPAEQTIAPGQNFIVESSWGIAQPSNPQDPNAFKYNYATTGPDVYVTTDLDFGMTLDFESTICVFGCTEFTITITLPPINLPVIDLGLPWDLCALKRRVDPNDVIPGFCPLPDPCDLFPSGECPSIFVDSDPYFHVEHPGMKVLAPGAATLDILKAGVKGDLDAVATNAFYSLSGGGRTLSSEWGGVGLAGITLDLANVAAALVQASPPFNGTLTQLLSWKNPAAAVSAVVGQLTDQVKYNIFDASLGVDLVVGQNFSMRAKPPIIEVYRGSNPTPFTQFRAGDNREIVMPDTVAPGTGCGVLSDPNSVDCLTFRLVANDPEFTTRMPAILDPRFKLSAGGLTVDVPLVGKVGLDSVYQSGDLLPPPPLFYNSTFDVDMGPAAGMMSSGFASDLNYDLVPIAYPNNINGRDLASVDGNNGVPRLIRNNEEINFAIINWCPNQLTLDCPNETPPAEDTVVVQVPGLRLKNVQVAGGGVFNLINDASSVSVGEDEYFGTYIALAGNALMPGLDRINLNLAIAESINTVAGGQVRGGLKMASGYGAFIRNGSVLDFAPAADGTMNIAGPGSSYTLRREVPVNTDHKGSVEVYSGCNTDSSAGFRIVDLTVSDSEISAVDFLLSGQDASCIDPNTGPFSTRSPIDVVIQDSQVRANVNLGASDTLIEIAGNSLVAGRTDRNANEDAVNRGRISVNGDTDEMTGQVVAGSVFDTGSELRNLGGTVSIGTGGLTSVLAGNTLTSSSQDGQIELIGNSNAADTSAALATVGTLANGYSVNELFAAFTGNPSEDAILLIDGGVISDNMISNQGGTILALNGELLDTIITSEGGRLAAANDGMAPFDFTTSQLNGIGELTIRSGTTLAFTSDAVAPMIVADNLVRAENNNLGEKGELIVNNDGSIVITDGPSSNIPVEFGGDAENQGLLELRNQGDILVQGPQQLILSGDTIVQQSGTVLVDGELQMIGQDVATVDEQGSPATITFEPRYRQLDGRTTINGTMIYGLSSNSQLEVIGGILDGNGFIQGNVIVGNGTISPGSGAVPNPMLTINGDYVQTPIGRLEIRAGSNGASRLTVAGPATLAGELAIVLDAAWWATDPLALGENLPIMAHGPRIGEFDSIDVKLSDGSSLDGYTFNILYLADEVRIVYEEAASEREIAESIFVEIGRFDDVPAEYWAYSFIETFAINGITAGCGADKYCPGDTVTRAQMAVFLERGMRGSDFVPPAATGTVFTDVPANAFAAAFIEQLFADGITAGCGNGKYCPKAIVTRAQMAVFLLRAKYGSSYSPPPATGSFADAPLGSFAVAWIEQLAAEGITAGCGNGNYCPNDPVTRAQMAVFMVRAFELTNQPGETGLVWNQGNWNQGNWQ